MASQIKINTPANLISQTQWRYWIKIGTLNTKSGRLSFSLYCTSNWWCDLQQNGNQELLGSTASLSLKWSLLTSSQVDNLLG